MSIRKGYETTAAPTASGGDGDDGDADDDSPLGRQFSDSARERMAQWAEREKEELERSPERAEEARARGLSPADSPRWPNGQPLGQGALALSPGGSAGGGRGSPRGSGGSSSSSSSSGGAAAAPGAAAASPRLSGGGRSSPGRVQLDDVTKQKRDKLFRRMDFNGNGALSLAEIDKAVVELWPRLNHKKPLMRAYKAADVSGDQVIGRREFRLLLKYLVYFNNLWAKFEEIDRDHDGRLSLAEFKDASKTLNIPIANWKAEEDFASMDENGGGVVLFDEFCRWCAERHLKSCKSDSDEEDEHERPTRSTPRSRSSGGGGGEGREGRASRGRYSSSDEDEDEDEDESDE